MAFLDADLLYFRTNLNVLKIQKGLIIVKEREQLKTARKMGGMVTVQSPFNIPLTYLENSNI